MAKGYADRSNFAFGRRVVCGFTRNDSICHVRELAREAVLQSDRPKTTTVRLTVLPSGGCRHQRNAVQRR